MPILNIATTMITRTYDDHEQILFLRRKNPPYQNYLVFPGGKIEEGETLNEAGRREIYEETGIEVDDTKIVALVNEVLIDSRNNLKGHFILYYYLCRVDDSTEFITSEEGKLSWINREDIDSMRDEIIQSDYKIARLINSKYSQDKIAQFECVLKEKISDNELLYLLDQWDQIR